LFRKTIEGFADKTPSEFFELVSGNADQFSLKTGEELAFDLQDVLDFYRSPISVLRASGDEKRKKRREYRDNK
jgi:hypothetical protein